MHIDMDCFFVSVGLRTRPQFRGLPVAVTHSKGAAGNRLKNSVGVDRKKEMELYVKRHDDRYKTDHSKYLRCIIIKLILEMSFELFTDYLLFQ